MTSVHDHSPYINYSDIDIDILINQSNIKVNKEAFLKSKFAAVFTVIEKSLRRYHEEFNMVNWIGFHSNGCHRLQDNLCFT
jgi:hypothetical protein